MEDKKRHSHQIKDHRYSSIWKVNYFAVTFSLIALNLFWAQMIWYKQRSYFPAIFKSGELIT